MGGFVGLFVALNSFTLIHNGMEGRGVKGDKCTRGQGRENVCSLREGSREREMYHVHVPPFCPSSYFKILLPLPYGTGYNL